MSGYRINEEDIRRVIRYLKANKPENANREYAIQLLQIIQSSAVRISINAPGFVEELERVIAEAEQHAPQSSNEGDDFRG